jgi:3-hydroxyisobutyrate dehydrogenase-like beta-hydroxyacid dehydrogenase
VKAGFIGLGTMGMGMARNLSADGQPCLVYSQKEEKLIWFRERGVETSTHLEDVAACDCIFLCLPDGCVVEEVVDKLLPGMSPGQILVDCSTIGYLQAKALGEKLHVRGIHFLDAPISGHKSRAESGTLTIMCGGEEETFLRVNSLLERMGSTVLYMGGWGSGQLTKMINNCALNICTASFCELMPLGVKLGLDPQQLGQVLMTASGSSYASRTLIPEILKGNFSYGFSLDRAYKDMEGMAQVCAKYQVPLPTLSGAMQTYQLALRHGEGGQYKGAMIRFYEEMLDVLCREKEYLDMEKREGGNGYGESRATRAQPGPV